MITKCNFFPRVHITECESVALSNSGDQIYSSIIVLLRVPAADLVSNVEIFAFN